MFLPKEAIAGRPLSQPIKVRGWPTGKGTGWRVDRFDGWLRRVLSDTTEDNRTTLNAFIWNTHKDEQEEEEERRRGPGGQSPAVEPILS
jgi:hypothetical protein